MAEHRGNELKYLDEELKSQLIKLPPFLHTENEVYRDQLNDIRSDVKFIYIVEFLYSFRSFLKLSAEPFDVDLFEEELLGINYQPVHSELTFINKLKLALMNVLGGTKNSQLEDFETVVRDWFGEETPLGGVSIVEVNGEAEDVEAEDAEVEVVEERKESLVPFDTLTLVEKVDILYMVMEYVSTFDQFRNQIDKLPNPMESRKDPIYTINKHEDYLLLEDMRVYKRRLEYPVMKVPKRLRDSSKEPLVDYEFIEPSLDITCCCVGIYEFEMLLEEVKKNKKLFKALIAFYPEVANADLRRRKQVINRKKEIKLQNLLATRKRSSRLEEKEKKKHDEEERVREEEELSMRDAASRRASKRLRMKEDLLNGKRSRSRSGTVEVELSREERMKLRRANDYDIITPTSATMSPGFGEIVAADGGSVGEEYVIEKAGIEEEEEAKIDHSNGVVELPIIPTQVSTKDIQQIVFNKVNLGQDEVGISSVDGIHATSGQETSNGGIEESSNGYIQDATVISNSPDIANVVSNDSINGNIQDATVISHSSEIANVVLNDTINGNIPHIDGNPENTSLHADELHPTEIFPSVEVSNN